MNSEYLLDAIGLLDDGLIREAEEYRRPKPQRNYASWLGWAASFAVVIVLGYGLTHLPMGGGSNMAPACSSPAASVPSGGASGAGETLPPTSEDSDYNESDFPTEPDVAGPTAPGGENSEFCPAIMVEGVLYRSTGRPVPGEVAEEAIRTVTGYTSGLPEVDGQTNFSPELSAQYAMTDLGLVVLMDHEWVLFEPVELGK